MPSISSNKIPASLKQWPRATKVFNDAYKKLPSRSAFSLKNMSDALTNRTQKSINWIKRNRYDLLLMSLMMILPVVGIGYLTVEKKIADRLYLDLLYLTEQTNFADEYFYPWIKANFQKCEIIQTPESCQNFIYTGCDPVYMKNSSNKDYLSFNATHKRWPPRYLEEPDNSLNLRSSDNQDPYNVLRPDYNGSTLPLTKDDQKLPEFKKYQKVLKAMKIRLKDDAFVKAILAIPVEKNGLVYDVNILFEENSFPTSYLGLSKKEDGSYYGINFWGKLLTSYRSKVTDHFYDACYSNIFKWAFIRYWFNRKEPIKKKYSLFHPFYIPKEGIKKGIENPYVLLGINDVSNLTLEKLNSAYRKKALEYHPDRNPDKGAKEMFQKVNDAFETLKNFLRFEEGLD